MKRHQLQLDSHLGKTNSQSLFQVKDEFGRTAKGKSPRSTRASRRFRPLNSKAPIHFCLRSKKAIGRKSFRHPETYNAVREKLGFLSRRWGVKVQQAAFESNHVHLLIQITNRQGYRAWVRALTSAWSFVLNHGKVKGFWDARPFTRIVRGLRGLLIARAYVKLNEQEALGEIAYRPTRLKGLALREWSLLLHSG
jgi:REP element-mobilizing transposase RayT